MGYCLGVQDLKPFSVVFPGLFIQHFISVFIASAKGSGSDKKESDKSPSWKAKLSKWLKTLLICYQIASMILVFVFDISDFVTFLNENGDVSAFAKYNCYIQIIVNSPNWKRSISLAIATVGHFKLYNDSQRNAQIPQQVEMQIDGNRTDTAPAEEATAADRAPDAEQQSGPEPAAQDTATEEESYSLPANCWQMLRAQKNAYLRVVLLALTCGYALILLPITMSHAVLSYMVYVWLCLLLIIAFMALSFVIANLVTMKVCCAFCRKYGVSIFGLEYYESMKQRDFAMAIINAFESPLAFAFIYAIFLFPLLSMAYLYQGHSYLGAVVTVFTERKVNIYMASLQESFANVYGFIATLF